eukprot:CAMPEP_0202980584 /NCGR_PEP_ID=MMETSP1396-20130829/86485_1 /ASSEMBLY_ACC=CAM_ASM_000872 /TAXON_ID= /ORGANISM="Pseudokeronopsis sp., Strain Brazil" /LENGTH=68 /DNA_ID=CAMNT_0049720667 /DNA_START=802 /DNA_END=1008 /DNA_ORIENTATION=+
MQEQQQLLMFEQLKNNNSLCRVMKGSEQDSLHQQSTRDEGISSWVASQRKYSSGILNEPASKAEFYHS